MRRIVLSTAVAAAALSLAAPAQALVIIPVSATGSSSYPGYPDSDAIDTDVGSDVSDWASQSQGNNSYLDLDLGAVFSLTGFTATDRVTSGGSNNGYQGGLTDFTTSFSLQFFSDATFTTPISVAYIFNKSAPSSPSSPTDFAFTGSLPSVVGRYVRYDVISTAGSNPGLSNITFDGIAAVPEPGTWAMMIGGFGLAGGLMRRRGKKLAIA